MAVQLVERWKVETEKYWQRVLVSGSQRGVNFNLLLSDVADNLSNRCFDADVHLTAVTSSEPTEASRAFEVTVYAYHLLQSTSARTITIITFRSTVGFVCSAATPARDLVVVCFYRPICLLFCHLRNFA